jgi:hypothetical protein
MAAATPETQTTASATIIEACDRLAQKLDELTSVVREQVQDRQQTSASGVPASDASRALSQPALDGRVRGALPLDGENPNASGPGHPENTGLDAPSTNGTAAVADKARRIIDTLSRSRDDWQTQAAGLQQALEAMMDFLEGQAAAAPKVDVSDIMSRLRTLEEEQQNLRSQLSVNRWGPS